MRTPDPKPQWLGPSTDDQLRARRIHILKTLSKVEESGLGTTIEDLRSNGLWLISEPTVRRDLVTLESRGLVASFYISGISRRKSYAVTSTGRMWLVGLDS